MPSSILRWAGVILSFALVASTARASPVYELHPSFSLAAGADDNLLFNGQGGDGVGRVTARLRYRVRDHLWSASVDGAASLYTFVQRDRRVPLGELNSALARRIGRFDTLQARIRMRGSDDPLALAQIGLLGGGGAALGFRATVDHTHTFTERWSLTSQLAGSGIRFFDTAFVSRSGEAAGLYVRPRYRLTRNLSLQASMEGRLFFGQGSLGNAVGLLPGVRYRVARRFFAEVEAGAALFRDDSGALPVPVARSTLTWEGRWTMFRLTASQDLTIPNGRAGVLKSQILESVVHHGIRDWDFGLRAGYYRSQPSPRADLWTPGFGVEAGAFYRVSSFLWAGVTALHFERLQTALEPSMSRNAIYVRFDFNSQRP